MSREQKIKDIEAEIGKTQYNKATQHHIGLLKARIAKLKEEIDQVKKGKGKTDGYVLRKSGDATVALLGFPSVGKSTLLNKLTNANSKVAAYEFTTLTVIPGLLEYNNAQIQIFDVPGIVEGAASGTGRGREVLSAIKSADMIIMLLDINKLSHYNVILKEVFETGIRLNQDKPDVKIKKVPRGGVSISSTVPLEIEKKTIEGILKEFRINNAHVLIRSKINEIQLIDVIEGNKVYMPGIVVMNKIDTVTPEYVEEVKKQFPDAIYISADQEENLEEVRKGIFEALKIIRIFLKEPAKEADMNEPMILKQGDTLKRLCDRLHKDFIRRFKFARVWGKSARFEGQKIVSLQHVLQDKDIVELHIR
ncbi:MAG: GTP-binding protein [Candidatus Woesearchaeota archaeon]|nr:GTP-binding protein [Candidatus Woesearchaeota archaeon]